MTTQTMLGLSNEEWIILINDEIAHEDNIEWLFAPLVDDSQLELFGEDAETIDYIEDIADRAYWSQGAW